LIKQVAELELELEL